MHRVLGFVTTVGLLTLAIAPIPGYQSNSLAQGPLESGQTPTCPRSSSPDLVHGNCRNTLLGSKAMPLELRSE